jgi:hypothetical protein
MAREQDIYRSKVGAFDLFCICRHKRKLTQPRRSSTTPSTVKVQFGQKTSRGRSQKRPISDLCGLLNSTFQSGSCLWMHFDTNQLWQVRGNPLDHQLHERPSVSLKMLLESSDKWLNFMDKKILAVHLAHSLLQLSEGPWIRKEMRKENIWFIQRASDGLPDIWRPHLLTKFEPFNREEDPQEWHRIHPFPGIVSLGILLLEIELETPIEKSLRRRDYLVDGQENINTNHSTALKLLEDYRREFCDNFRDVVKICLNHAFPWPEPCADMTTNLQQSVSEIQAEDEELSFQNAVFKNIVMPLEKELCKGFPEDFPKDSSLLKLDQMSSFIGMAPRTSASGFHSIAPEDSHFKPLTTKSQDNHDSTATPQHRIKHILKSAMKKAPTLECTRFVLFDDQAQPDTFDSVM